MGSFWLDECLDHAAVRNRYSTGSDLMAEAGLTSEHGVREQSTNLMS